MITLREYVDGKADIQFGSFGVPMTQKAKKQMQAEKKSDWKEKKKEE